MARYFFHVVNGEFIPDPEGQECADLDAAKKHAVIAAGQMLADLGLDLWKTRRYDMFVTDEKNQTCLKLAFKVEDLTANRS